MHNPYGRSGNRPKMIVIHAMGEYIALEDGSYMHAPDFLEYDKKSAHVLITPNGGVLRLRNDDETASHAKNFNTNSLGMEILVAGKHTYKTFAKAIDQHYVTDEQYAAAVAQCREWVEKYNITRIVRHSDLSPGRKIDPGDGFLWDKFLIDVRAIAALQEVE